jgi:hypothetical protein
MKKFVFFLIFILSVSTAVFSSEDTGTEYFAIFMAQPAAAQPSQSALGPHQKGEAGSKVGYAMQSRSVEADKVTTTEEVTLTIARLGTPVKVYTKEAYIETTDGKPLGFEAVQQISAMPMKITGTIDEQGMVHITTEAFGSRQQKTIAWPQGALMAEGVRLLALKKGLREGLEYSTKVFEPSMQMAMDLMVKIGAKEQVDLLGRVVSLTEVNNVLRMPNGVEMTVIEYVDDQLRTHKFKMNMAGVNVEMIGCTKEFALSEDEPFEMVSRMFITSPEPIENINSVSSITYHLIPTDTETTDQGQIKPLLIPSTDSQSVRQQKDGKIIVTVKPVTDPKGTCFPYKGGDEKILAALKAAEFVQSDNKKIIELAQEAVGDTKDAAEAARKIEAFVADYIEAKDFSVGYASATEVAESRKGDCSEFAVLTAAMCRAVGIPAQVVMGIAYIGDFAGYQNCFGGHAWVQAYVGDRWIGLDASFKHSKLGGFGAGHIALAVGNGDPKDFFGLVTIIGRFKIDKLKVYRDNSPAFSPHP